MQKVNYFYVDPQSFGNLSVYDYNLLTGMQAEVLYVCSKRYDYKPLPPNIHQTRIFGYSDLRYRWMQAVSYVLSCVRLLLLILRYRPTTIHVQWLKMATLDYWLYRLMKKICGVRVVFTAHNILPHDTGDRYAGIYGKWYELVDIVIVHTADTQRQLHEKFGMDMEKTRVINHGILRVEVDEEEVAEAGRKLEADYDLKDKFVITSLGYQLVYKGIDLITEAWASTPELAENDTCRLLLIGKNRGVDMSPLDKVKNACVEDRYISNPEFVYLMRRSNLTLMVYRQISQSGALLTALAEHTPVLVSEVGGLTEPLKIAKVGWSIRELDVESVREALCHLVAHQDEVRTVKEDSEAWERIEQAFDWTRIAQQTQACY